VPYLTKDNSTAEQFFGEEKGTPIYAPLLYTVSSQYLTNRQLNSSFLTTLPHLYNSLPCSVSIPPYHATTDVYFCRFCTGDLDLPAIYFDPLIPFPLYHATTNVYIHTGDLDLPAFYFIVDADVQHCLGQADAFQFTNALQYIFAPVGALMGTYHYKYELL
jgi:hypothetical protein